MLDEPPFTGGQPALFDLVTEPLVVVDRTSQQVECDLVYSTTRACGQTDEPSLEFGRELQVHGAA